MFDDPAFSIKRHKIIILIIPHQGPRADLIHLSAMLRFPFHVHIPLEILEGDLLLLGNGIMDLIDRIVNGFIHGFDPVRHINLPGKLTCLMNAGQSFDFPNQRFCFFLRDESGGLNCINQQLQLSQFESPAGYIVFCPVSFCSFFNIQSKRLQCL